MNLSLKGEKRETKGKKEGTEAEEEEEEEKEEGGGRVVQF